MTRGDPCLFAHIYRKIIQISRVTRSGDLSWQRWPIEFFILGKVEFVFCSLDQEMLSIKHSNWQDQHSKPKKHTKSLKTTKKKQRKWKQNNKTKELWILKTIYTNEKFVESRHFQKLFFDSALESLSAAWLLGPSKKYVHSAMIVRFYSY